MWNSFQSMPWPMPGGVVVGVSFLVLFMQLVEEPVWVGVLAFHVAQPFAGKHAVFVAHAPVVDEHAFDGSSQVSV